MMNKIKVLLDTDLGSDCDDAGALALLHNLADTGMAEILAVTHCGSEISGAITVKAINEWYKRGGISVSRYDKSVFLGEENCKVYTQPIMKRYLKTHSMSEFESSVKVMRRALSQNREVTIAVIGALNNIAELLKSEPDDISPLSGIELVKPSVKNMYVMGGNFKDLSYAEWNIQLDVKSAQYVSENFPMPIIYCGFEIGENIFTGERLKSEPDENPVKISYSIYPYCINGLRNSWDPITVYSAVNQDNPLYIKSAKYYITFDNEGKVLLKQGGKDCYIIADADTEIIREVLDKSMY